MKSACFAMALFCAAMASAAIPVEGGNIATVAEIQLSAGELNLISVPVSGLHISGAADELAYITNILPPKRYPGAKVYFYSEGSYNIWLSEESDGAYIWEPLSLAEAGENEVTGESGDPAGVGLNHGSAIWLELAAGSELCNSSIYLCGQLTSCPTSVIVSGGTLESPGYNLIGFGNQDVALSKLQPPAYLEPIDIGNMREMYKVVVPGSSVNEENTVYYYVLGSWYSISNTGWHIVGETVTIPAGRGFWFMNPHATVGGILQIAQ